MPRFQPTILVPPGAISLLPGQFQDFKELRPEYPDTQPRRKAAEVSTC